jgi:hypothetical protein
MAATLVWSAALDAVERPLAGVVKNPESFLVSAILVRLDIKFQKQPCLGSPPPSTVAVAGWRRQGSAS